MPEQSAVYMSPGPGRAVDATERGKMMLSNWIFVAGVIVFIVLFISVVFVQTIVKKRLKKFYANNTVVPAITFNPLDQSANRTMSFLKFIAKREYGALNDNRLTRDCDMLRILYICYILVFIWVCFSLIFKRP